MSGIFTKKHGASSVEELLASSDFVALGYHLAGAAEMASAVLGKKEDPEVVEISRVLGAISSQFLERSGLRRATAASTPETRITKRKE